MAGRDGDSPGARSSRSFSSWLEQLLPRLPWEWEPRRPETGIAGPDRLLRFYVGGLVLSDTLSTSREQVALPTFRWLGARPGHSRIVPVEGWRWPRTEADWQERIGPRTPSEAAIRPTSRQLSEGEQLSLAIAHTKALLNDVARPPSVDTCPENVLVWSISTFAANAPSEWGRSESRELLTDVRRSRDELRAPLRNSRDLTLGRAPSTQLRQMRRSFTHILLLTKRRLDQRRILLSLEAGGALGGLASPDPGKAEADGLPASNATDGADSWTPTECETSNSPRETRAGPSLDGNDQSPGDDGNGESSTGAVR